MYFDIHTHNFKIAQQVTAVENISRDFSVSEKGIKVTMGLHPWYLGTENWQQEYAYLEQYATREEVIAIGECGLDRFCKTDLTLQILVFEKQIQLADRLGKPLIIHCVKAFSECLTMLTNVKVPVVFHGINNKLSTVKGVIDKNYYLSFGKALLGSNKAIQDTFRQTPLDQVFLETDDTGADIMEIYKLAAEIKNIDEKEIVLQLERNFLTVFGE